MLTPNRTARLVLWIAVACTSQGGWLTASTWAQGEPCTGPPPSTVRVDALSKPPEFDLEKTISDLTQLSHAAAQGGGDRKGPALGFYQAKIGVKSSIKAVGHDISTGGVCLVLRTITINFGLQERKILLAQETQGNRCVRDFVTAHEQRHVAVDDAVLRLYLVQLQAALSLELSGGLAVQAKTPSDARQLLMKTLDARLQQAMEEFSARRDNAQQAAHAEEEADALEKACGPDVTNQIIKAK